MTTLSPSKAGSLRLTSLAYLTLLSLSPAFAASNLTGPGNPQKPAADAGPVGQIASPGDPFMPWPERVSRQKTETFSMSCAIGDGKFANGLSIIKLVNTSQRTIPAGTAIEVIFPDGTKKTITAPSDIKPGASLSISGPADATPENFSCTASASRKITLLEQGSPDVTESPNGLPATPPKLSCWFEIMDGKVVIHWKNTSYGTVPVGAMITGKNDAGIGIDWFIQDPIKPGETVSFTIDIDPKFFNEACVATITQ